MKKIIPLVYTIFLLGCTKSEKEIAGVYLKEPSANTIDSLFIFSDSLQPTQVHNRKIYKYKQVFYKKRTRELLFVNKGTWWLSGGKIELMNLYFDADNNPDDYSHSKEAIKNAVTLFSTSIEGENIIVEKGVYYKKVK
jgi:hypothetical protein